MLSLILSNTNLFTAAKSSSLVVLLVNWIISSCWRSLTQSSMCILQHVGSVVAQQVHYLLPMVCLTCLCKLCIQRGFVLLHIYHYPIQGQVSTDIVYSALSLHGVLHVEHKMTVLGTALKPMTFLHISVVYICSPKHDNHAPSIYAYWIVSYLFHDQSSHVHMLYMKDVFDISLLNWCMYYSLRCELPSVSCQWLHWEVAQLSSTL